MNKLLLNASLSMVPEDILPSAWLGHVPFAFWVVEEARPDILVELGTHNGTSFLGFCQAIKERGVRTKAFAVDTWEGDEHAGHYGEEVFTRLDQLVQAKYAEFAQLMRMRFDDAMPNFSEGSIDLLHIDGLHTYDAVKHDFDTWLPKMSRRGVVIFHDTMVREREFGVWQLWETLRDRYPSFEFKHTHGLGVLLVGDEPPASLAALCALTGTPAEASVSNLFAALGHRFKLLERIDQLEARQADAMQHAANYRSMYETAEAAMRHSIDSFGPQLEDRRREVEAASAQISELMAQIEFLRNQAHVEQSESDAHSAQINELRAERDAAKVESEIRLGQIETSSGQAAELRALVESLTLQSAASLQRIETLALESASSVQRLEALSSESASTLQRFDVASAQLRERTDEVESLKRDASLRLVQVRQVLGLTPASSDVEATEPSWLELVEELTSHHARHLALQASEQSAHERIAELTARQTALQAAAEAEQARLIQALAQSDALRQSESKQARDRQFESDQATAALRHELRHRDSQLQDSRSSLSLRQLELARMQVSNSWRITAPIRWVRGRLAAFRGGTRAPTYSEVMGIPGRQGEEPADFSADVSLPTASASTAEYLRENFAVGSHRRAPEYLGSADTAAAAPTSLRAKAIAFYLPQFHRFPENDAWWGDGFTEWTNVTAAVPQFVGHEQPQLPADLGFYDLSVPDVVRRQVELARRYGIHGFAFHYYWFGGKRLMEKPLDLFLAQEDLDFPFCLCWANENWTRRWDGRDSEVLISQEHGPENDMAFIRDIERYLRDRRYIRIDGKPLLIVYRASMLPDAAATLVRWRNHCREVGIGELFIVMAQFDAEDPRPAGFDAAVEFPPHKLAKGFDQINKTLQVVNPDYRGSVFHYQSIVDSAKSWPAGAYPLIRTVFPGWDNEARRAGKGYTFAFSTPERYREWLEFAVDFAEKRPVAGEKIVMINAWNEWAEGAKLEPDARYGHAYLDATRKVLDADGERG